VPYFPYHKLARIIASSWGNNSQDKDTAVLQVTSKGVGLADVCLAEIVRVMMAVGKALTVDDEEEPLKGRPEWAEPFPDAKVGDLLYSCGDTSEGVNEYVVVGVMEGGYIQVALTFDDYLHDRVYLSWGSDDLFPTPAEALMDQALDDAEYHGKHLALAKKIIKAVKSGGDLTEFCKVVESD
jgi:hypothetical protein